MPTERRTCRFEVLGRGQGSAGEVAVDILNGPVDAVLAVAEKPEFKIAVGLGALAEPKCADGDVKGGGGGCARIHRNVCVAPETHGHMHIRTRGEVLLYAG